MVFNSSHMLSNLLGYIIARLFLAFSVACFCAFKCCEALNALNACTAEYDRNVQPALSTTLDAMGAIAWQCAGSMVGASTFALVTCDLHRVNVRAGGAQGGDHCPNVALGTNAMMSTVQPPRTAQATTSVRNNHAFSEYGEPRPP